MTTTAAFSPLSNRDAAPAAGLLRSRPSRLRFPLPSPPLAIAGKAGALPARLRPPPRLGPPPPPPSAAAGSWRRLPALMLLYTHPPPPVCSLRGTCVFIHGRRRIPAPGFRCSSSKRN
uniref:formin-G-like n=1 Tax=Podarcis muralis TaxID=64176 RepID=UPI0010A04B18|nr:formin-G-like [Podarcis muralis]